MLLSYCKWTSVFDIKDESQHLQDEKGYLWLGPYTIPEFGTDNSVIFTYKL